MEEHPRPKVTYDVEKLAADMAAKGWNVHQLARVADVTDKTITRFLERQIQTAKTIKKLADALGHSVRRYIVASRDGATA
jgi:transcriptional regulator with XRE-family HTH domain